MFRLSASLTSSGTSPRIGARSTRRRVWMRTGKRSRTRRAERRAVAAASESAVALGVSTCGRRRGTTGTPSSRCGMTDGGGGTGVVPLSGDGRADRERFAAGALGAGFALAAGAASGFLSGITLATGATGLGSAFGAGFVDLTGGLGAGLAAFVGLAGDLAFGNTRRVAGAAFRGAALATGFAFLAGAALRAAGCAALDLAFAAGFAFAFGTGFFAATLLAAGAGFLATLREAAVAFLAAIFFAAGAALLVTNALRAGAAAFLGAAFLAAAFLAGTGFLAASLPAARRTGGWAAFFSIARRALAGAGAFWRGRGVPKPARAAFTGFFLPASTAFALTLAIRRSS